ncbi:MAG: tetratricopeptide repeat protein [Gemmatimonadaceae bacterium]|nr:tetratricopeptide repeat protein [Gemmatimonadaceae bacterium]
MTTPNLATRSTGGADETVAEWLTTNWRMLTIGAAVVAAAGGGYWLWGRQTALKEERAEKAFAAASQIAGGGDQEKARTELQKMVDRYNGTNAGGLGAMVLAQQLFEQDKAADGVKVLEKAVGGAPSHLKASMEALIASGLAQQGKEADAAARYVRAAGQVTGAEKDGYLADAARAYAAAGNKAEALKLWQQLADKENSSRSIEARIRVGELSAKVQPE